MSARFDFVILDALKVIGQAFKSPRADSSVVASESEELPHHRGTVLGAGTKDRVASPGQYDVEPIRKPKPPAPAKILVVPATFKMVFLTIVALTVAAGIAQSFMAGFWTAPTPNEQSVFEGMGYAWKTGVGAIFGLLGGKVLN